MSAHGSGKSGSHKGRAAARRAHAAAVRQAAARAERRSRLIRRGSYAAIALAAAAAITAAALYANHRDAATGPLPRPPAAAGTALPPWPAPPDPSAGITAAGLRADSMEGTAEHFHAHLDIIVDGKAVPVPADLGINPSTGLMSELHTHDTTGVLHIEAPDTGRRYALGQLFAEWGVRLDAGHLGGLTAGGGATLRVYVDGKPATGDPAGVELLAHREIALVFGPAGASVDVPSSYSFPAGE